MVCDMGMYYLLKLGVDLTDTHVSSCVKGIRPGSGWCFSSRKSELFNISVESYRLANLNTIFPGK